MSFLTGDHYVIVRLALRKLRNRESISRASPHSPLVVQRDYARFNLHLAA